MASDCDFAMLIVGKPEDCKEWIHRMESYDNPHHFYRMNNIIVGVMEDDPDEEGRIALEATGYCAWSLDTCCRPGTYCEDLDLFAVNSKELNIDVEAFSMDPFRFQEHYRYRKGKCEVAEEREYHEFRSMDEAKEFYEERGGELPDDLREDGYGYVTGGWRYWDYEL